MPNRDEVAGRAKSIKGRVKEAVAEAAGDERAADEGRAEQLSGEGREVVGGIKRRVKETGAELKKSARDVKATVRRGAR
jgi:uncharacterized protein YjbJ (UPF0337 family)